MHDHGITVRGTIEPPAGVMQFWRGDVQIAVTALRFAGEDVHANLNHLPGALDHAAELVVCVREMHRRLVRGGTSRLVLFTDDWLTRDAARRAGMIGELRGPLSVGLDHPLIDPSAAPELVPALCSFGVDVHARPAARGIRDLARASASGIRRAIELDVRAGGPTLLLSVPDAEDLLVEQVARIADTAAALAARFRPWWVIDTISVDRSTRGLDRGHTTGQFDGGRRITLTANSVLGDRQVAELRRRFERSTRSFGPRPVFPPARHLPVEKTVAHEVGHQLWMVLERRHPETQHALDRSVAEVLGVGRLADVLDGERPGAPDGWAAAASQVRAEVSDYAMTNLRELVAELFGHWWTREHAGGLLGGFGRCVDDLLPAPAGG